ncbi:cardiolipin synthase [Blochmannia endosymbiont of Camponotus (Colobopsis) obliquus]|uniref:cardiolipin synthase n=1 Tax=Blochmannia endosymbiont of Camponotus (Colobopsis) obliquus TaxID=1505597 RepID=UPI00061A56D1|nr:cardiolipin synthase [Blochmannia endosymbiont of Camponotus (Colobopsis) obliquus]AKC60586.1 cardiolipin synthase [Blochmannia endosymbiont of Camponotus (Colobopsis) obliquus]
MVIIYYIINWFIPFSYWLLIVSITLRILMKRRAVNSAISWLLIIYTIPVVGIIIYLLFGELNVGIQRAKRSKIIPRIITTWINKLKNNKHLFSSEQSEVAKSLFQLCEHRQGMGGLKGKKIKLLNETDKILKKLIQDIKLAQKTIDMIFYIWHPGGLVNQVILALISASQRGVRCRLILDSAGSVNFFRGPYPAMMQEAGIHIVEALNINLLRIFLRRMDLRQHRKMILIDNYISYTGSMNMIDPLCFRKTTRTSQQWIDIMVRMEGPVTPTMGVIFSCDWEIETGEHILPPLPTSTTLLPLEHIAKHTIQVIASGPGFPKGMIQQALITSLYAAQRQLIITTPYLVPSDDLLHAICTAAQRGVEVHLIVPLNNDSILVNWASKSFFDELLDAGVLIHQFEGGLLHTKSVLVDEQLSLIGTVNLDIRSLWINFEITLIIDDANFGNTLAQVQKNYIAQSVLVDQKKWLQRPYWQRIIEKFFYFFSPLL